VLLLTLLACDPDAASGPFALAFDGGEDCVEAELGALTPPAAFTVEAWIRGEPVPADRARPVVSWKGVFTLGEAFGGDTVFTVGDAEAGATSAVSVMDGVLHHVAGTWDGEKAHLYVDGVRQAFVSTAAPVAPTATLRIGCDSDVNTFEGVIDEVRVSSSVRYTEDGSPPSGPFDEDAETFALFHLDEGEGTQTVDAAQDLVGAVYGPEWVPFKLTVNE
jgi:hypothetical protein